MDDERDVDVTYVGEDEFPPVVGPTRQQVLIARFDAGEKLSRRDRRYLDLWLRIRSLEELEHICAAIRGER